MANERRKSTVELSGEPVAGKNDGVSALARRKGGPRTVAGKRRSRLNAIKNGIYSTVVVLEGESRKLYESLHRGMWNSFRPVGEMEEFLVEKLTMLAWRHRRVLIAETGEIIKHERWLEVDREDKQYVEAQKILREDVDRTKALPDSLFVANEGLVRHSHNLYIINFILKLLNDLRAQVENLGLSAAANWSILATIYGDYGSQYMHRTLFHKFDRWIFTAEMPEGERARQGLATPEQCKECFLKDIDAEISGLMKHRLGKSLYEEKWAEVERTRQQVPDSSSLDRLIRYETHIDRMFARTLDQLERLQRMRLGQAVPPPLKIEHSIS